MPAYSGLFDGTPDVDGVAGGHSLQVDRSPAMKRVARALKRRGLRRFGNFMAQLATSDTPDANITYTQKTAETNAGGPPVNGGAAAIAAVTVQLSSTNYSAADAADAEEMGNMSNEPATYPTDAGGNGGGGKSEGSAPSLG